MILPRTEQSYSQDELWRCIPTLDQDRYDLLAQHFVNVGNVYSTDEEVIAFLKRRVQPIPFTGQKMVDALAA